MATRVCLFLLLSLIVSCAPSKPDDLQAAARSGSTERVKNALELGANINEVVNGRTALHAAVVSGKPENVVFLLSKGADPTVVDSNGRTAWQALWKERASFLTSSEGDCAVALLEAGVKPGELEETTYLHEAAYKVDNSRLIALLIESGIGVNARDKYGWAPLHFAAGKPNVGNVEALLSAKADPNAESTEVREDVFVDAEGAEEVRFRYQVGTRPLDVARYSRKGKASVHDVLRKWGATENPDIENVEKRALPR